MDPDINYFSESLNALGSEKQTKVVSVENYNDLNSSDESHLTIYSANIRSFSANSDAMFCSFSSKKSHPKVLVLTETWFQDENVQSVPNYNGFHTMRPGGRGGGVSIYVAKFLTAKPITKLSICNETIEINAVEVISHNESVVILGIYRPHSDTIRNFTSCLTSILNSNCIRNKLCVLIGDFNANLFSNEPPIHELCNSLHSYHYIPVISKPTHYCGNSNSPSLIDHIWINKVIDYKCGVIESDLTDHCPIFINIPSISFKRTKQTKKITFRLKTTENRNKFFEAVQNFDWSTLSCSCLNRFTVRIIEKLNELYCSCFPLITKVLNVNKLECPWITPRLRKLINIKSKYFQLFKLGIVSKQENNIFKNKVTTKIRKAKTDYYSGEFEKNKSDIKKTWDTIYNLLQKTRSTGTINMIKYNENEISNDQEIADIFNKYFSEIGLKLDENLPNPQLSPIDEIRTNPESISLNPVSVDEISKIILNLKPSKQKRDEISTELLKQIGPYIAPIVCTLINECFSQGIYPDCLKLACITPIFKSGNPLEIENYRPISILSLFNKIFEKSIYNRLSNFVTQCNIIAPQQFGFQKGLSTELAVTNFTEKIYDSLNNKKTTVAIFIDLSKAFDTVNHAILLKKLEVYGIRGVALSLLTSYLTNRKHVTRIGNFISAPKPIQLSVPQGTHLAPLLFLLYINDLPHISNLFAPILFADDLTISFSGKDVQQLENICNNEINKIVTWTRCNRLSINYNKTFSILISNQTFTHNPDIIINGNPVQKFPSGKFLGVTIDESLNFKQHIDLISKKVSKNIGILYKLNNYLPKNRLVSLYYTFIYPYLLYCNLVWGGTFNTHLEPLFKLQKRAIRVINKVSYLEHTNQLFFENKILKLQDIHKLQLAVYVYKLDSRDAYVRTHDHHTRNRSDLIPSYARLTSTQKSLSFSAINFWNTLPDHIKNSQSLPILKKRVKLLLLSSYDDGTR